MDNSKRRFHYDEVDELLEKKSNLGELSWIYKLFNLTQILRKARLKNAFEFKTEALRMFLNENLSLKNTFYEKDTPSHGLIEDCMLLANKAAAKMLGEVGIFRNHAAEPMIRKLQNF